VTCEVSLEWLVLTGTEAFCQRLADAEHGPETADLRPIGRRIPDDPASRVNNAIWELSKHYI
jgi:hypothetical protein